MGWQNLDLECAIAAHAMYASLKGQDAEKLCTDASAVLSENGPYAFFLYLWSRRRKEQTGAAEIFEKSYEFLKEKLSLQAARKDDIDRVMSNVAELSKDLNRLLLAKKLLMQTLSYLRYAMKGSEARERKEETRT